MDIRTKEAIRYLGYGKSEVDEKTRAMIAESFLELQSLAEKRYVSRTYDISFPQDGQINVGQLEIQSRSLCKNLCGCSKVYLFAATLGTEVDRQIRKYEVTDLPKAVVFQACAAAYLEEYCDMLEESVAFEIRGKEGNIRPRFSPGYGDFSIIHQKDVLGMLDAGKTIGLTMTEGYMLTPSKSVTALIGIGDTKE